MYSLMYPREMLQTTTEMGAPAPAAVVPDDGSLSLGWSKTWEPQMPGTRALLLPVHPVIRNIPHYNQAKEDVQSPCPSNTSRRCPRI